MSEASQDQSLAAQVRGLSWYHKMDLGGVVTPGRIDTSFTLPPLHFPSSFAGKTVLDIGAWDGFYSFEAARRGATRVLATDSYVWNGNTWGSKDGFLLARKALGLEATVGDQTIDVMDISEAALGGKFDVTLLLGVLYHLTDPITALERVSAVTKETLIVETESTLNWLPGPAATVYAGRALNNDPTNFYCYNLPALKSLLREQGFARVEVKYKTPPLRRVARGIRDAREIGRFLMSKHGQDESRPALRGSRVVLHAHRS